MSTDLDINPAAMIRSMAEELMEIHENVGIVATLLVEQCRASDPTLLSQFLDVMAVETMRAYINKLGRSTRARTRIMASRSVFAQAATEPDPEARAAALAPFLTVSYVVDDNNNKRRLMDMTKDDLLYAASAYTDQARRLSMEAAFLRAISNRVGGGVVSDYFTAEQLLRMRQSLG